METRRDANAPYSEDQLHALVDGQLAPEAAAAVRRKLASDAEAQATVNAWEAQRDSLKQLYGKLDEQPLPASLLAAAGRADQVRARATQSWRWGGMAASLLLAFGVGWVANGQWQDTHGGPVMARAGSARHFAEQAVVAHALFQPEQRHPVEVSAAQQEHLLQWLSKRLGRPLKVPVLTAQGYDLMGGRLLPGDNGARAQFMYQNSAGQRLTLYVGAVNPSGDKSAQETAFRFLDDGPVPGFYWVDQGFGYAIAGQLPRTTLQELALVVYRQL